MNEIERRIYQAQRGRRNLEKDYLDACEAVSRAHAAFNASRGPKGKSPAQSIQETYARALRELDVATRAFQIDRAA